MMESSILCDRDKVNRYHLLGTAGDSPQATSDIQFARPAANSPVRLAWTVTALACSSNLVFTGRSEEVGYRLLI